MVYPFRGMFPRQSALYLLLMIMGLVAGGALEAQDSGARHTPTPPEGWEFSPVNHRDGLVNSSISVILQDEHRFLWFGTQAGLHRYDGYTMDVYTAEPFNRNSLSNQLVQTAYLDHQDVLWVGTYGGLDRFDTLTGTFRPFPHTPDREDSLSNNVVTGITRDGDGTLWAATLQGLNRLDNEETGTFTRFLAGQDSRSLPHNTVRAVHRHSDGTLWIGSLGGLSRVEPDDTAPGGVSFVTYGAETLASPYVMAIREDRQGVLWLAVWDAGVIRFDPATRSTTTFPLEDNRTYTLLITRDGMILAATWGGGLAVLNEETGLQYTHRHNSAVSHSLAHNVVYSLYEDASGIIWIGTNGNAISKLDRNRISYRYLHQELPEVQRPGTGKVQVILRHRQSNELFIGYQNSGLSVQDPLSREMRHYRHNPADQRSISSDTVNGILPEPQGTVLVSTHNGINRYHPPQENRQGYFERLDIIPDPIVYRMIDGPDGAVWIGTYSFGLFRWDPATGDVEHLPSIPGDARSLTNELVYDLAFDHQGDLWVATNNGLNRLPRNSRVFQRFFYDPENPAGISASNTSNILVDSRGTVWIGSRSGGINRYHRETGTFSHISTRDGLSSNTVTALLEGDDGLVYIATPNGMNVLNPESREVFQIDERDGLAVREFSTGAMVDVDNTLLFGAFSEIVRVPPIVHIPVDTQPRTVITGIRVGSETHTPGDLTVRHTENFLDITFALLEFTIPERNSYRYRLVGLDDQWTDAGTRRSATYTNLPPGTFRFEVVGTDARGNESAESAAVTITITPPFWRTPWFITAMTLMVVAAVILAYRYRVGNLRRQTVLLEETVAQRTAELSEANMVKDRFFSIIAHDLRGPLAGIASITDRVATDFSHYNQEALREIFETMQSTSRGILRMLENLLEWARVQSGTIRQDLHPMDLHLVAAEILESYGGTAREKGVDLQNVVPPKTYALADDNMMRVILENLVNNGIKFTNPGGSVTISLQHPAEERVVLAVRDTGVGIDSSRVPTLFRVDSRTATAGTAGERGSGFGLALCSDLARMQGGTVEVESAPGEGTTVRVTMPRWQG